MKTLLYSSILLLISLSLSAQTTIQVDTIGDTIVRTTVEKTLLDKTTQPLSTESNASGDEAPKRFYQNGQVESIGNYINSKKEGPFEVYYENGQLKAKGTYKTTETNIDGNKEHGLLEMYDEKGELMKTMNCNLGICLTTWKRGQAEENN